MGIRLLLDFLKSDSTALASIDLITLTLVEFSGHCLYAWSTHHRASQYNASKCNANAMQPDAMQANTR